jgi:hypothetical protein
MAQFCESCGTEVGFFSRKRVKRSDGRVLVVCRDCADEARKAPASGSAPAPGVPMQGAALRPAHEVPSASPFEVVTTALPPPASTGTPALEPSAEQLLHFLLQQAKLQTGVDLGSDAMAVDRLRQAAARAVVELQSQPSTEINLPFLTADATGPKHLVLTVRSAQL